LKNGVLKIIDFGVSGTRETLTSSLNTQAGTLNWMAPGEFEFECENVRM
jgi:serine/threonine protein kinase